jgi:transcriptional regulator with XRE-family HTH domain
MESEIGALIREYRLKAVFTQKDLAEKLGYTQSVFVSLIEKGVSKVPLHTLGELIKLLSIPEKKVTKILVDSYSQKVKLEISLGKRKHAG